MEEQNKQHIIKYSTYIIILLFLITFTLLSVLVTSYELGPLSVTAALFFAVAKSTLVLLFFMHLKFDQPIFRTMFIVVISLLISVLVITFLDYSFR